MRLCPFCDHELAHLSGYERSGPDYGGNTKEVDYFLCTGCRRELCHVVKERFTGVSETWELKGASGWTDLPQDEWPG